MLPLVQRAFEGKYHVEREIGKGGNARIYLARDRQGQRVALKVLHPELLVSVAADRFLREIRLSSAARPPAHRPAARFGRAGLDRLLRHDVRGGSDPAGAAGPSVPPPLRRSRPAGGRPARCPRPCPPPRHRPPGREAGQHRARSREGAVLLDFGIARAVAASRQRPAHPLRDRGRHLHLHEPGADHRAQGDRPPERHLLAGLRALRVPSGAPSLHAPQRGGGPAATSYPAGARRPHAAARHSPGARRRASPGRCKVARRPRGRSAAAMREALAAPRV